MTRPVVAVLLWSFCVLMGAVVRYAMVAIYNVWTPDGRLNIEPWQFTFVSAVPLWVAGGLYLYLIGTYVDNGDG